jgi:hypothetical protein
LIDAILYAVRDGIRAANIGYGYAECDIMDNGQPPPRCGKWFVAIHGGKATAGQANDNNLFELYEFVVTVTMRVVVPLDKVGSQQIALNVVRELALKQGFNARVEKLRAFLHMNWDMVVTTNNDPPSANDNLVAWLDGTVEQVYGFSEPMRWIGATQSVMHGGEWFAAEADAEDVGISADLRFHKAKRFQPQTTPVGSFV